MTASWLAYSPVRIVFGAGEIGRIGEAATGERIVLVTTPGFTRRGVTARIVETLGSRLVAVMDRVDPNPGMEELDSEAADLRRHSPDMVIGLGGGSSLDTAKALALHMAMPNGWSLVSHFEGKQPLPEVRALPIIAVPTTAGTGAEVTPFATVWDHRHNIKYSLADESLFARAALLDPELTLDLPREVTIASGLDAISQAIESIWNRQSNPVTSAWAIQSLRISLCSLERLAGELQNIELRSRMLEASLLAGLAISVTRTSICHSMSYPLTAHFGVPHGLACSFTLPAVLEFNLDQDDGRLAAMTQSLGWDSAKQFGDRILDLLRKLGVADAISSYVGEPQRMFDLVDEMITPGRADTNMVDVSLNDVRAILERSIALLWRS